MNLNFTPWSHSIVCIGNLFSSVHSFYCRCSWLIFNFIRSLLFELISCQERWVVMVSFLKVYHVIREGLNFCCVSCLSELTALYFFPSHSGLVWTTGMHFFHWVSRTASFGRVTSHPGLLSPGQEWEMEFASSVSSVLTNQVSFLYYYQFSNIVWIFYSSFSCCSGQTCPVSVQCSFSSQFGARGLVKIEMSNKVYSLFNLSSN